MGLQKTVIKWLGGTMPQNTPLVLPPMPKVKPHAETSFLLHLNWADQSRDYIVNNAPFGTITQDQDHTFVLQIDAIHLDLESHGQPVTMIIDYTNDPTPVAAGLVCSLGYYTFRLMFLNVMITNKSPLTFKGTTSISK